MSETEYNLRRQIYALGCKLRDYDHDPEDVAKMGEELVGISGVCDHCKGDGIDGDPPDAAGEGGWMGPCEKCAGGFIRENVQAMASADEKTPTKETTL